MREYGKSLRSFTKHSGICCSNTGSIRGDRYSTSREKSSELIELSSIEEVSLVQVSSCINTGSTRDSSCWISRKNSLELAELSDIYLLIACMVTLDQ